MKSKLLLCGLLLLAVSPLFAQPHDADKAKSWPALKNAVILIIRHAEKLESGDGLSAPGEDRARHYVDYFRNLSLDAKPLKLDYLFAAADSAASHRPRLTITPFSQAAGLPIDSRFKDKQFAMLAEEIQSRPHGKAILICWHHGAIPELLDALGADAANVLPKGKWPDDVFGWMIQLCYDENGKLTEAKRINQNLMPEDSKKHEEL